MQMVKTFHIDWPLFLTGISRLFAVQNLDVELFEATAVCLSQWVGPSEMELPDG